MFKAVLAVVFFPFLLGAQELMFMGPTNFFTTATTHSKKASISESQVYAWVRMWQERLKLLDWKIETKIVRATKLKPDTLCNIKWSIVSRTAVIKVLDPRDYEIPENKIPDNIELTIVHELVHLQLSPLPRDLQRKDVEEEVVIRITNALINLNLDRKSKDVAANKISQPTNNPTGSAERKP